ncbi:MAG: nicotinate (nicotinamide) nucleotide adenylyltransferase [Acholeplasmataceae bacterium]|jgi:nicotinate-nucleotide adenylyltransferase|nr:nicotinate (nicotinamide) nucleotide adenylyltransferase [Acholeplasmataceae bacterium]
MHIVFGGSFNPPTNAHVKIIKHLLSVFKGSKVIIVPVGDDYRKPELAPFKKRLDMLRIALDGMEDVMISSIEADRGYEGTLQTLDDLSKHYDDLHFVIGSDNLLDLPNWIRYQELLSKYPFIVINREGYMTEQEGNERYKDLPHRFIFVDFNDRTAATHVRMNMRLNRHVVDPKVYDYIVKHHIYEVK